MNTLFDTDFNAILATPAPKWDPAAGAKAEQIYAKRAKLRRAKQLLGVIQSITVDDKTHDEDIAVILEVPVKKVAFEYHQLYYKLADWAKDNDCDLERTMELLRRCHTEQMENPALRKKYRDEALKLTNP
jgi:hypothetical protein